MAGARKAPEKKQASLTSFFTPRTVNGLSAVSKPQGTSSLSKEPSPDPPRKRPLEEATDKGNEIPSRLKKRPKGGTVEDDKSTFFPTDATSQTIASAPKASARTERYVYEAGRSDNHAAEEEEADDDASTRRRKEELHRKFVKKLGHPDSISQLRRRNYHDDAAPTADGEDAEDAEDPEEDEAPKSAKSRKKGAKTGKLTPMEIQFLDIKRKNMDTLLIVEVGYKFKFFGEDARIAAKELSIVCIPGKFRYDERKYSQPSLRQRPLLTSCLCRSLRSPYRPVRLREYSRTSPARPCEASSRCRTQSWRR